MPTSWLTQIPVLPPISASLTPAALPASNSAWPTCSSTPRSSATSPPEFIEITGMPAATARWIEGASASASGMETTSPSGSWLTAASISWPMATMSKVSGAR